MEEKDIDDFKVWVVCEIGRLVTMIDSGELDLAGVSEGLKELGIGVVGGL